MRSHVVITSYSVVASEYSSYQPDAKDESKGKGKKAAKHLSSASESDNDSDDYKVKRAITNKKRGPGSGTKDALFRVRWWRIVLGNSS